MSISAGSRAAITSCGTWNSTASPRFRPEVLTILLDGVAAGMLLFVLACGLSVTMGLMNFVNLAHGAFGMAGGYVLVLLLQRGGWPFLACLPAAFLSTA